MPKLGPVAGTLYLNDQPFGRVVAMDMEIRPDADITGTLGVIPLSGSMSLSMYTARSLADRAGDARGVAPIKQPETDWIEPVQMSSAHDKFLQDMAVIREEMERSMMVHRETLEGR